LPSSFSRVLSSALEYSSRAPVSVCGTVVYSWSLVAFPGSRVSLTSAASRLVITPHLSRPDLPRQHDYTLEPGHPTPGRLNLLRPPIASLVGTGILTRFPSTTALALVLGADSPCADERGAGNLGLSASRPFTCFIATHVSIRTSDTSSKGHPSPSQAYGTLSYHPHPPKRMQIRDFGA
jgi:hypothetical protein